MEVDEGGGDVRRVRVHGICPLEVELAAGGGAQVEGIATYAGGALDDLALAHGRESSPFLGLRRLVSRAVLYNEKSRDPGTARRWRQPPNWGVLGTLSRGGGVPPPGGGWHSPELASDGPRNRFREPTQA